MLDSYNIRFLLFKRFTTVRFFKDFAYAVTFLQIDPFYVVDLNWKKENGFRAEGNVRRWPFDVSV